MMTKRKVIVLLFGISLILAGCFHALQASRDDVWYRATAEAILKSAGAATIREQVDALRAEVRRRVRPDSQALQDRPFLRASGRETLQAGRGQNGDSCRAFIRLARAVGITCQRVNLFGPHDTVVVEVEMGPGRPVLVAPHEDPETNAYFDGRDRTLDEVLMPPAPFASDYSNINLRRVPLLGDYVRRVRTPQSGLTDLLESPLRMKAVLLVTAGSLVILLLLTDLLLIVLYHRRLKAAGPEAMARSDAASGPSPDLKSCPTPRFRSTGADSPQSLSDGTDEQFRSSALGASHFA